MVKNNLEKRMRKAVLAIEKDVSDIGQVVRDLCMKLCYLIKDKRIYYDVPERKDSFNGRP